MPRTRKYRKRHGSKVWLIGAITAILLTQIIPSGAMEFRQTPKDYKNVRVEFYDTLSGVRITATYGTSHRNSNGKIEGELTIMGPGDSSGKVPTRISSEGVEALHHELGELIHVFSLDDDPDQPAVEKRLDSAEPSGFQITIFTQETSVTLRYSHLDSKRFSLPSRLFFRLLDKFPSSWNDKITWRSQIAAKQVGEHR